MGQRTVLATLAGALWLAGCDEPPVTLDMMNTDDPADTGPSVDRGMDPPDMMPIDVAPPPPDLAPGCEPPRFENDVALFGDTVAGPLYEACSLCHSDDEPGRTLYLTDNAEHDAGEAEEFVLPSCLENPASCEIIAWHPEGHPGFVEEPLLGLLVAWIEAGAIIEPCDTPPPPDMGVADGGMDPGPTGVVPCEALPPMGADLAGTEDYRMDFERPDEEGLSHNDILVGSCARNGTCHALAGNGDGYFLITSEEQCATDWNFFVTQLYVDLLDPQGSPLLTLPRDRRHGGRRVFQGTDDERHVRLLQWIREEVNRRR